MLGAAGRVDGQHEAEQVIEGMRNARIGQLIPRSPALGDRDDEAATAQKKALDMANPLQIHFFARGLQGEKRNEEAFAIFRENAKKHPDQWFVHSGLARMYCSQGKFDDAAKEMKLALAGAPDNQKSYVDGLVKRLEAKQDINQ